MEVFFSFLTHIIFVSPRALYALHNSLYLQNLSGCFLSQDFLEDHVETGPNELAGLTVNLSPWTLAICYGVTSYFKMQWRKHQPFYYLS